MTTQITTPTMFWSELAPDTDGYGPGLDGKPTCLDVGTPIEFVPNMTYNLRRLAKSTAGYAWLYASEFTH